jgi:hypothetical protein
MRISRGAAMELYRPRSSSIPRHYRQIPAAERFTVTDAAQLKLKLQALDDKLEPGVDVATLTNACLSRPFHEEIYVDGSEEFYLLVKSIPRADLIPSVYIKAYATAQQGRFPLNHYTVSDFRKGVDPTFSDIRKLLGKIDQLCGTRLDESYCALEDRGKSIAQTRIASPSLTISSQAISVPSIACRARSTSLHPPATPRSPHRPLTSAHS